MHKYDDSATGRNTNKEPVELKETRFIFY